MHEGPTENRLGELGSLYKYYYYYYNYYYVAIKFYFFYLCIIFLQLGLLDDAITHTKDILQKGMANSKILFFKSTL